MYLHPYSNPGARLGPMAQSYSDTEHSSSNYSSSYPSLSDSTSSHHINSDIHPYESPNFGIHPRQPSLARPLVPHTPHGLASISLTHVSNPTPQNFQSLQEYTTRTIESWKKSLRPSMKRSGSVGYSTYKLFTNVNSK